MILRNFLMASVAAGGLAFAATSAQAGIVGSIDEFNSASQLIQIGGIAPPVVTLTALDNESTPGAADGVLAADIVGGYRDMSTTLFVSPDPGRFVDAEVLSGLGEFSHDQDSGVISTTTLTWNGLNDAGLGGFDATVGGFADTVRIGVVSADQGIIWDLTLIDTSANSETTSIATGANIANLDVDIDLFATGLCTGSVDCTSLDAIIFTANTGQVAALDTAVDYIRLIDTPEPATLSLLGMGLIGLGVAARRRREA